MSSWYTFRKQARESLLSFAYKFMFDSLPSKLASTVYFLYRCCCQVVSDRKKKCDICNLGSAEPVVFHACNVFLQDNIPLLVFSSLIPDTLAALSNNFATPSNSSRAANSPVNSKRTKLLILSLSRKMKKRVCMSLSATPAKLRSKPALPANQNRFEASSRVKAMPDEYEYLLACREAEAEKNLMLQRQQIAFSAWLNFVFKQPERLSSYMTGTSVDEVVRTMTKDSTENQALCNQIKAAIKIQSAWRRMQHHSKYLTITRAVIKIQSYWRSCLARRYFKVLKENSLLKSCDRNRAAVKIQCAWKGARYQSQFRNWRLAAIRIQSTFRMYLCKKSFQSYKEASVVVQSFTRVELALQNYKHITCDSRNDGTTISASEKAQVVQILTKYMPPSNDKIQKSVLKLQGW